MSLQLDSIDWSIIKQLMVDGRMSATQISHNIGNVPERTIQYRLEQLLDKRVIRIFPTINFAAIGVDLRADMLIDVKPQRLDAVAKHLASFNRVSYVASIFGEHDLSVTTHARNNDDFYTFINESVLNFPGVQDITVLFVPKLIKNLHEWGIHHSNDGIIGNVVKPVDEKNRLAPYELDSIDEGMINLLRDNGRTSIAAIARRLGDVSEQVLRDRLNRLLEMGVIDFVVLIDQTLIGYSVSADIFIKVDPKNMVMAVASALAQYQETAYVACSMGGPDVSIQIIVRDYMEVYNFVRNVVHALDDVTHTETILIAELVKHLYNSRLPLFEASNS